MKRVLELENHHGKNHEWILNLREGVGTFDGEQNICTVLKCLSTDCLLDAREKIVAIRGEIGQHLDRSASVPPFNFEYIRRSGTAGSYSNSMFSFVSNCQTVFNNTFCLKIYLEYY